MRLLIALALALTLVALPAAAEDEPHITDQCGDAVFSLRVDEDTTGSPDPASPSFDILAAWFTTAWSDDTVEGVDLSMQLCGDAVEPQWGQHYAWRWTTEAGCDQAVVVGREMKIGPMDVTTPLVVRFSEKCLTGEQILVIDEAEYPFEVTLDPAEVLEIDGDTITVSLRAADLPAEALPAVAAATRWVLPYATTQMVLNQGAVFVWDQDASVYVYGGSDRAVGGRDYVVGE